MAITFLITKLPCLQRSQLENVFVGPYGTLKLGDLSHGAVLPHGAKVVDGEATDYDR